MATVISYIDCVAIEVACEENIVTVVMKANKGMGIKYLPYLKAMPAQKPCSANLLTHVLRGVS